MLLYADAWSIINGREVLTVRNLHLSPKSKLTPSKNCERYTAGDGRCKDTYRTKKEANARVDIRYNEQGIDLRFYRCKYEDGCHLTKRF